MIIYSQCPALVVEARREEKMQKALEKTTPYFDRLRTNG